MLVFCGPSSLLIELWLPKNLRSWKAIRVNKRAGEILSCHRYSSVGAGARTLSFMNIVIHHFLLSRAASMVVSPLAFHAIDPGSILPRR